MPAEAATAAATDDDAEAERRELLRLAFDDFAYCIAQEDVESATYALDEAAAEGGDPTRIAECEKQLQELRQKVDPEGEARRRRVEARQERSKDGHKWNFSGKSRNVKVNDRFREHEEELQRRRLLAYKGRGQFRARAEDEGEEAQEKEVRKQRAEANKEKGYVAPPPRAAPSTGFAFMPPSKQELEAPRTLTLMSTGVDLHASWWGMVVDGIDDKPGQPGLRLRDTIIEVSGTTLRELEPEDCEQRFADLFGDGSVVTVEPHVEARGTLVTEQAVDRGSMTSDLERFSADWSVEALFQEIGSDATSFEVVLQGTQSAVKAAKPELEGLMKFYVGSG